MKPVALSERLRAAAAMVTAGNRVCDVGCDHGFVPVWLVEQGVSPHALAMDVRSGPLSAAREHIAERGLEAFIETRLSDGLHNYISGEAETLICAGMGGRLMMRILSEDREKTASFRELILQPQSMLCAFRKYLRSEGHRVEQENMIEEDGKFYTLFHVRPYAGQRYEDLHEYAGLLRRTIKNNICNEMDDAALCTVCDRFGLPMLQRGDRTLTAYLRREERICEEILDRLRTQEAADDRRKKRCAEMEQKLRECRMALRIAASGQTTAERRGDRL